MFVFYFCYHGFFKLLLCYCFIDSSECVRARRVKVTFQKIKLPSNMFHWYLQVGHFRRKQVWQKTKFFVWASMISPSGGRGTVHVGHQQIMLSVGTKWIGCSDAFGCNSSHPISVWGCSWYQSLVRPDSIVLRPSPESWNTGASGVTQQANMSMFNRSSRASPN